MWQTHQHVRKVWSAGDYLSLITSNLHPRPTTTYAEMHSSGCYFGITSICSVLNRAAVKSRLNTAPSYRAILARVSVAVRVQIWCRARETSVAGAYWLRGFRSFFKAFILFLSTLLGSYSTYGTVIHVLAVHTWNSGYWLCRPLKDVNSNMKTFRS